jgi:beta-lactamase regulating signal transducer with metallopeptidase domain
VSVLVLVSLLLVKPALVVATAWIMVRLIAWRGAAARHALWAGCAAALVLLPLFRVALPDVRVAALGPAMTTVLAPLEAAGIATRPPAGEAREATNVAGGVASDAASGARNWLDVTAALWSAWAAIALLLVARRIRAEVSARRLIAQGRRPEPALAERFSNVLRTHGTQGVTIVIADEAACPAVAGLMRPAIILPAAAVRWTDPQLSGAGDHGRGAQGSGVAGAHGGGGIPGLDATKPVRRRQSPEPRRPSRRGAPRGGRRARREIGDPVMAAVR